MNDRFMATGHFFIKEVLFIYLFLLVITFIVFLGKSFFSLSEEIKVLANKNAYITCSLASLFGIIAPLDSCSVLPLFFSLIKAGMPLPATFAFLLSSSTINLFCLSLLLTIFTFKFVCLYTACGFLLCVILGFVISQVRSKRLLESFEQNKEGANTPSTFASLKDRFLYAKNNAWDLFKHVWFQVLLGVGIGAIIHGFVPVDALAEYSDKWYAVPLATLIGIPLYFNAAGVIPLVQVFVEKGMSLGTAVAFLMAATGLSLAQCLILQRVIRWKLLFIFVFTSALGIICIGYLFDFIF